MITVNNKKIQYEEGMTLAEAIEKSEDIVDDMTLVMVDKRILSKDRLKDTSIKDGTHIKLLKIISGG